MSGNTIIKKSFLWKSIKYACYIHD